MSQNQIKALHEKLERLEKRVSELEKSPVQCGCDELADSVIKTLVRFKQAKLKQG